MKKKINILPLLALIVLLMSCRDQKLEYEYNHIKFKEPISQVVDSMKVLIQYMDKGRFRIFYIRYGTLYTDKGDLEDYYELEITSKILSNPIFKNLTYQDVVRLTELLKYLRNNYITGILQDAFQYKDSLSLGRDNPRGSRGIIIDENNSIIKGRNVIWGGIVDHKENLYLLAPLDYIYFIETRSF